MNHFLYSGEFIASNNKAWIWLSSSFTHIQLSSNWFNTCWCSCKLLCFVVNIIYLISIYFCVHLLSENAFFFIIFFLLLIFFSLYIFSLIVRFPLQKFILVFYVFLFFFSINFYFSFSVPMQFQFSYVFFIGC